MDLASFKITFDGILQTYVQNKVEEAQKLINDKKIDSFIDYISSFIFSGGKRIRPYGLRVVYTGFGGTNEKAVLNFGIIFELLHTMALIHDDVIDQADKRHNALTVHSYIRTLLATKDSSGHLSGNAEHIAEGQAILLGDLLLSRVYELRYKQHDFPEHLLREARKNVHSMIEEVILGQMIDVDMMISGPASLDLIDKKNMYKTASYTFIRPMVTGAILAGASKDQKELIIELGRYMGLAFQMRDDYLDIIGGDKTKSTFSDIQEGQQTYFTNYIYEHGTKDQQALLSSCMGNKLSEDQIHELQHMFEDSGALAFGRKNILDFSKHAKDILKKSQMNDTAKTSILGLIKKMEKLEH